MKGHSLLAQTAGKPPNMAALIIDLGVADYQSEFAFHCFQHRQYLCLQKAQLPTTLPESKAG